MHIINSIEREVRLSSWQLAAMFAGDARLSEQVTGNAFLVLNSNLLCAVQTKRNMF